MWCRCAGGDEDLDDGRTGVEDSGVNLPLTLADITGGRAPAGRASDERSEGNLQGGWEENFCCNRKLNRVDKHNLQV